MCAYVPVTNAQGRAAHIQDIHIRFHVYMFVLVVGAQGHVGEQPCGRARLCAAGQPTHAAGGGGECRLASQLMQPVEEVNADVCVRICVRETQEIGLYLFVIAA
eukprot:scaffold51552_cov28-Tisochrysis_lutea.AAC.1